MSMRRRHYKTRREHAPGSGGRAVWAEAGGRSESIWKQREYGFDLKTKGYTITSPGTLWAFNTRLSSAAERPCSVRSHADADVVTSPNEVRCAAAGKPYLQRSHVGHPHENGALFGVVSEVARHLENLNWNSVICMEG